MGKPESFVMPFPSLDDSPLWADDFTPPREAERRPVDTPPLVVIREHYPRIAKAIELMWGTREMDAYFSRLVVDDRNGRAGFPAPVLAAILKLSADHARRFGFEAANAGDAWGNARLSKQHA